jgi:hypothetical protein
MMMSGGSRANKSQGGSPKSITHTTTVKPLIPRDEVPAAIREQMMANIPPFQRDQYDVIKVRFSDGVYNYDLVDKFTRQLVKYNNNIILTQSALEMYSQIGVGEQMHSGNSCVSFGVAGVNNMVGSTG